MKTVMKVRCAWMARIVPALLAFAYAGAVFGVNVAKIGDTEYESLADAIAAVPTDGTQTTVTLIADEATTENQFTAVEATQNVILDLNGHTVSQNASGFNAGDTAVATWLIYNEGTLEICDTSEGASGKLTSKISGIDSGHNVSRATVQSDGVVLTVTSGTIEHTTVPAGANYAIDHSKGELNINGGYVHAVEDVSIRISQQSGDASTVNVTGGTIEGVYSVQSFDHDASSPTTVNISGGTLIGDWAFYGTTASGCGADCLVYITGGTFQGAVGISANFTRGNITISGGKFDYQIEYYGSEAKFLKGGLFKNTEYCLGWVEDLATANTLTAAGFTTLQGEDEYGVYYDVYATLSVIVDGTVATYKSTIQDFVSLPPVADGYVIVDNDDPGTMTEYPFTIGVYSFVYPIAGTGGIAVTKDWLKTYMSDYTTDTGVVPANKVDSLVAALAEDGVNGMPRWESFVLGLNPGDVDATLDLTASPTASDISKVTVTGVIDTSKFPTLANTTVTFRLVSGNSDGSWTDIATGSATPSFDVALEQVVGKVLAIFADISTQVTE